MHHSWWLLRVIGGSGPGVAVLSDVAVQTLIQDLPVLYRCMMCQFCYAFSAHAYERRDPRLCACLPCSEELVKYDVLDSHERERSEFNAEDSQTGTPLIHKKKKKVCLLPQVLEHYFHNQRLNRFLQDAGTTLKFKACFGCYSIAHECCGSRLGSPYFCLVTVTSKLCSLQ